MPCEKKEKTSQYRGVDWHKQSGRWRVQMLLKNGKPTHGGMFKDELDAAKRANQLCEQLGISPTQNFGVVEIPTQVLPVAKSFLVISYFEGDFPTPFKLKRLMLSSRLKISLSL